VSAYIPVIACIEQTVSITKTIMLALRVFLATSWIHETDPG